MPILASLLGSFFKPENESDAKPPQSTPPAPVSATAPTPTPASVAPAAPAAPKFTINSPPTPRAQPLQRPEYPPVFSPRSLKQLGLYFGGAGFLCFSIFITRRAITRHRIASRLKFYEPNHWRGISEKDPPKRGDPLVAFEALNLATLNTFSFFIMAAGGVSWALNISSAADLTALTRRSIQETPSDGVADEEAEQEVTEWFAKTLGIDVQPEKTGSDETSQS